VHAAGLPTTDLQQIVVAKAEAETDQQPEGTIEDALGRVRSQDTAGLGAHAG
jgi:hypothetical protein